MTAEGQTGDRCVIIVFSLPCDDQTFSALWLAGSCSNISFWYRMVLEEAFMWFLQWRSRLCAEGRWAPLRSTCSYNVSWEIKGPCMAYLMQEENHCWQSCSMCVTGLSFWFSCCVETRHNTFCQRCLSFISWRMYFCISSLFLVVPLPLSFSWLKNFVFFCTSWKEVLTDLLPTFSFLP